jgi:hypothetical protein
VRAICTSTILAAGFLPMGHLRAASTVDPRHLRFLERQAEAKRGLPPP